MFLKFEAQPACLLAVNPRFTATTETEANTSTITITTNNSTKVKPSMFDFPVPCRTPSSYLYLLKDATHLQKIQFCYCSRFAFVEIFPRMKSTYLIPAIGITALALPLHAANVITGGHVDIIAFEYSSISGFEAEIHNEGGPDGAIVNGVRVETESHYEPDETTIVIPNTSSTIFDSNTYFWLPSEEAEAANNGVIFAGIGLEELAIGDWLGDQVTLTLTGVVFNGAGTGRFLLWTSSPIDVIHFDSENLATFNSLTLPVDSHTHYNWGFSDEGIYEVSIEISGTHLTDGLQTGTATYTFQVIPEPSTAMLGALGALALLRRKR